jgi:hypothetical protein
VTRTRSSLTFRERQRLPITQCRVADLSGLERGWLLFRASEFEADGRPTWTYAEIAYRFAVTRRHRLSRYAVRRLVLQVAPEIAARRGASNPLKRRPKATADAAAEGSP